jgi:hypothetical protein
VWDRLRTVAEANGRAPHAEHMHAAPDVDLPNYATAILTARLIGRPARGRRGNRDVSFSVAGAR